MRLPRWVLWLVRRLTPGTWSEDVIGDLEEVHRRRLERGSRLVANIRTGRDALMMVVTFGVGRARLWTEGSLMTGSEARLALRLVLRSPLMSLTSVFALGVGIGLATTGFTVVAAILNPELPFAGGERFVEVRLLDSADRSRRALEPGLFRVLSERGSTLEHVGAVRTSRVNVEYANGEIELVGGVSVTPATFRFLPYPPVLGRLPGRADALPGAPAVVAIRSSMWQRRFGGATDIIGRRITVGSAERTIVGVVSDDLSYPAAGEIWLPLGAADLEDEGVPADPEISVFGVLAAGVDADASESQLTVLASNWAAGRPGMEPLTLQVRRVGEIRGAGLPGTTVVVILLGLLVVVAGNVANLVIARTAARRSELAVRTALGAARWRLVSQLSLEVLIMAVVAGLIGVWSSQAALSALVRGESEDIPLWVDLGLDARTLMFAVGVTLLVTIIAGMLPALRATRSQPGVGMRGAGRGAGRATFGRLDDAMIVVQIALSIGVLGAAAVLNKGWQSAWGGRDLGIPAHEILAAQLAVTSVIEPGARPDSLVQLRDAVETALGRIPGVVAFGTSTHVPGSDAALMTVVVEPRQGGQEPSPVRLPGAGVGPGFLDLLAGTASAGRLFRGEDYARGAAPVAIVNQPFVDRELGGSNAIGRRIRLVRSDESAPEWREIVGVVPDLGLSATDPERAAGVYIPMGAESAFRVLLRAEGPPAELTPWLLRAVFAVDPDIAVSGTGVLSQHMRLLQRVYMIIGSVFTSLGGIVLLLSLMAIFAILSFEVTRRTREIGVRVALGASESTILRTVLGRVAVYVAVGGLSGIVLGSMLVLVARAILVMRFPASSPLTFVHLVIAVSVAGLAAAWIPARRALRIRPMEALRSE